MKNKLSKLLLLLPFILTSCKSTQVVPESTPTNSNDTNSNEVYHTITFDSDGGSKVASIKVKHNEKIPAPANPNKENFRFGEWYLFNGRVEYENFEVVNGETKFNEEYLYRDSGYYLAETDITFKAYWTNLGSIKIWYGFNQTAYASSNLENKVNSVLGNLNVSVFLESKHNYSSLNFDLVNSRATGIGPELIIITATELINPSDVDKIDYEYNPSCYIEEFSDYYMPFIDNNIQSFVLSHFDSSFYQFVQNENGIFGLPLFSYDTALWNSNELLYNLPAKTFGFAFVNKFRFQGLEDQNYLRTLTETFALQLSQSYLEV